MENKPMTVADVRAMLNGKPVPAPVAQTDETTPAKPFAVVDMPKPQTPTPAKPSTKA